LVLVNDPGFGGTDTTFFKGSTMTYYGRWTYKFEEAARHGAKDVSLFTTRFPQATLITFPRTIGTLLIFISITVRTRNINVTASGGYQCKLRKTFPTSWIEFQRRQSAARQRGFKGKSLGLKATVGMTVKSKYDKSYNVIGKITGKTRPDEYILYSAHWITSVSVAHDTGDTINNGAKTTQAELPDCLSWPGYSSLANNPTEPFCFSR